MSAGDGARVAVRNLIEAIGQRDLDALTSCFTSAATYRNVPHTPAVGHDAIRALFAPLVRRCERIQWDIVSEAYAGNRAHIERLDRFWIDGQELVAPCHAVIVVDPDGCLIREFRDYVDLAPWRAALAGALA